MNGAGGAFSAWGSLVISSFWAGGDCQVDPPRETQTPPGHNRQTRSRTAALSRRTATKTVNYTITQQFVTTLGPGGYSILVVLVYIVSYTSIGVRWCTVSTKIQRERGVGVAYICNKCSTPPCTVFNTIHAYAAMRYAYFVGQLPNRLTNLL